MPENKEVNEIHPEDLQAAEQVYDNLINGTHYAKQEQAARELGFTIRYIG